VPTFSNIPIFVLKDKQLHLPTPPESIKNALIPGRNQHIQNADSPKTPGV
jgi:hypothetical protein